MLEDSSVNMDKAFEECCQSIRRNGLREALKENERSIMTARSAEEKEQLLCRQVELARKIKS